jgi:predicted Rossmann fold nucleotide-binding protein DprA/Smf involved in DNA uptake
MLVTSADDIADDLKGQREPDQMAMFDGGVRRDEPLWDESDWLDAGVTPDLAPGEPPFGGWHEAAAQDLRASVVALLSSTPSEPDDLARALGVSAREIQILLYDLESEGRIDRPHGGGVVLRPA